MATIEELKTYYSDLLISQYNGKPNAVATIKALVGMTIMDKIAVDLINAFDLSSAVGDQLDVIGKYVGASRKVYTFSGTITLDDDDFRSLIKFKIIKNISKSSLYDIQVLINSYFGTSVLVFDTGNMQLSYMMDESIGSLDLAQALVVSNSLPVPMSVQLASVIYSNDIDKFYGYRTYDYAGFNVSPMNDYDSYDTDSPWLSYSDALYLS